MIWSELTKKSIKFLLPAITIFLLSIPFSHGADNEELAKFLDAFQPQDRQAISNLIDQYRASDFIDTKRSEERQTFGSMDAPMSLLEWIDIQCPHCKNLNGALEQLQTMAPPNAWRVESRHFPLDNECNPHGPQSRKPGVSCLAAKVLICLTDKSNYHLVRNALFNQQRFLTKDIIWNTAANNGDELKELKTCVNSEKTAKTLKEDIDLAQAHGIRGTPLVVINGREAPAVPPIIYSLILAEGDANAEPFKALPPPQEMKDGHEGHNH